MLSTLAARLMGPPRAGTACRTPPLLLLLPPVMPMPSRILLPLLLLQLRSAAVVLESLPVVGLVNAPCSKRHHVLLLTSST
jgi:hypothetical protein